MYHDEICVLTSFHFELHVPAQEDMIDKHVHGHMMTHIAALIFVYMQQGESIHCDEVILAVTQLLAFP